MAFDSLSTWALFHKRLHAGDENTKLSKIIVRHRHDVYLYGFFYIKFNYVCMYVYTYMIQATTVGSLLKVILPTVVARGVYVCMFICMSA